MTTQTSRQSMYHEVIKNRFGYYELKQKPTPAELEAYYAQQYYQESKSVTYAHTYTPEEHQYIQNRIEQKQRILNRFLPPDLPAQSRFLDIGCGEGWSLKAFKNLGWDVVGLDYSQYGCQLHNPDCLDHVMVGPMEESFQTLIQQGQKFDCIWMDNVFEHVHVLDPISLLKTCTQLIQPHGIFILETANDFSVVQEYLYNQEYVSRPYWVVNPDHISYFNREGLLALCAEAGWESRFLMGDYPIDLNLFNPNTNYIENKAVGKSVHQARVTIENLLHEISPEKTIELYRVLGELGLGRNLIGFFQLANSPAAP